MDTGTLIADRYELQSICGEGGWGRVFKAWDKQTGHTVAVKLLHSSLVQDKDKLKRFELEARAASSFQNPNVACVVDWGINEHQPYIVMEFVEGVPLNELLKEEPKMEWKRAAGLFAQICSALHTIHEQGIVHRDLKPGNIVVGRNWRHHEYVKLLDFGLAKIVSMDDASADLTKTGEVIGSPNYMSPEQCTGNPIDLRSDIYSLGCVLYEVLFARKVFPSDNPYQSVYKHVHEDAQIPNDVIVPKTIQAIVLKCLQKDPADRYQTAGELRNDLMAALEGAMVADLVAAGRKTPSTFVEKQKHKLGNRAIALLAALAVAIICGAYLSRSYWLGAISEKLTAEARDSVALKRWQDAEEKLKMAVTLSHAIGADDERQIQALWLLKDVYREKHESLLSAQVDKKLETLTKPFGSPTGVALYRQAELNERKANLPDSEDLFKQAIEEAIKSNGNSSLWLSTLYTKIAHVYVVEEQFDAAQEACLEALRIREKLLPRDHALIADTLVQLGRVYGRKNQNSDAERLFKEALYIAEKQHPEDPDLLMGVNNNMVSIYLNLRQPQTAEQHARAALSTAQRVYGAKSARSALFSNNLAETLRRQKRFEEAESVSAEAIRVGEQVSGERNPDHAGFYTVFGAIRRDRGDLEGAERAFQKALWLRQQHNYVHPQVAVIKARLKEINDLKAKVNTRS